MKTLKIFVFLVVTTTILSACFQSCKKIDNIEPQVETLAPDSVSDTSAILQAKINLVGTEAIIRQGFCWLAGTYSQEVPNPDLSHNVIEVNVGDNLFTTLLLNLEPYSTYYVRAFVETKLGVTYGQRKGFVTKYKSLVDIDGNKYTIIKIGEQYWTMENLNVTRLRDGTPIPNRVDDEYWGSNAPKEPAMCWYQNNRNQYQKPYGALYNWHAASHPLLAPEGYRVPTYDDFVILKSVLDGLGSDAGGRMKVVGTFYWHEPNTGATNDSKFSAYPGGGRGNIDGFQELGYYTYFWASSSFNQSNAIADLCLLAYDDSYFNVDLLSSTSYGLSLRLVKN